ncbi:concanavalin A-like lectin/glucanase [Trichocladium antarcticum]|uniref:Concanavalin A-like lectin/glucanase n=1 Tax=Trichocladium antarcticum TaxID=1450529 RepID=A0AAN6UT71_9PEZI|nr:concanavalin A-like lectin/glucanase [Trichocladium antarcticum]
MRFPASFAVLVAGLAQTQAQYLINELSFGHGNRINPDGRQSIPNFSMQGRPNVPELLSNKVILTPVAPGNQRGAVWADRSLEQQSWIADVEFRANGQERGGGNLNIWLVRDGAHTIGSNSIYTAGRFEGLALVVDQSGGSGGMLRGFLNDGTKDYMSQHNVDSLSFGHCSFAYRNLGRPTQIKLRQTEAKFSVEVAGRSCFESDKIRLPSGYNFGITAASANDPDSFEVFKLVVLTGEAANPNQPPSPPSGNTQQPRTPFGRADPPPNTNTNPNPDPAAAAQLADLPRLLQTLLHAASAASTQQHADTTSQLDALRAQLASSRGAAQLDALESRLGDVERELRLTRHELAGRVRDAETALTRDAADRQAALAEHVRAHATTGHARLILVVVVGGQLLVAGGYVWYKRREATPKKYL